MEPERQVHHWRPGLAAESRDSLLERLRVLAQDRASSADRLLREACPIVDGWLATREEDWSVGAATSELAEGLADFERAHGWRAPVERWLRALRECLALYERASTAETVAPSSLLAEAPLREVLAEELGLWLSGGLEEELASLAPTSSERAQRVWSGRALDAGLRLPPREACALHAAPDIEEQERIAVHGYSETVALVLEELHGHGARPLVLLSEGGPDLGGRRMAHRLSQRGLDVTLAYDAALFAGLARCDRFWIGSEAVGEHSFLARVGTSALLDEARRQGVSCALFATSDKQRVAGEPELPQASARAEWLLWESPPEGVRVDSQPFELVPLAKLDQRVDEAGARVPVPPQRTAAGLSARAQPTPVPRADSRATLIPAPPGGRVDPHEQARHPDR